jgi:hypothetical protein
MLLRNHPFFRYHGVLSWPPVWTWTDGVENDRPKGEIGILRKVELSNIQPADSVFYTTNTKGHCISAAFCSKIAPFVIK